MIDTWAAQESQQITRAEPGSGAAQLLEQRRITDNYYELQLLITMTTFYWDIV